MRDQEAGQTKGTTRTVKDKRAGETPFSPKS